MCGINGFSWKDEDLIKQMNRVTRYRGPDDTGIFTDDTVSLGHTRLAIIDLSERGHQPMSNEDKSIWIIYNGEIYNFKELRENLISFGHIFQSDSDTEVILHAYEQFGIECVRQFNGMWAFCIYDKKKDILILSRDQFGIKPLYYTLNEEGIVFSSMIAGILCHEIATSPNNSTIMQYLAYNLQDHDSETFFNNVQRVPSGNNLIYDIRTKHSEITEWYQKNTSEENVPDIRDLFFESVKRRTVADVPIGSCLSGGIDSSAIVCILDRILGQEFHTFSYVIPGSVLDESKYIKEVGNVTKTKQFFTGIEISEFLKEFQDFILCQEEPVTNLSVYAQYRVMKLAHENGTKVLFDGQGGDELFAGYDYYYGYYFYELLTGRKWTVLIKELYFYYKNFKKMYPHVLFLFIVLPDRMKIFLWKTFINKWINHRYLDNACGDKRDPRWNAINLKNATIMTLFTTALPHLMSWEDKNSMRWSIESRPTFLDVHLVEAALNLPSEDKLKDGFTKVIFKNAVSEFLPKIIRERKDKNGFETPIDEFFRDEKVIEYCNTIIYSDSFKTRPYWNWHIIERMFRKHIENRSNSGVEIWKWINLELWLREYFPTS